ncbi:MAG TPA: TIGR04255 family protein [Candidatus Saccharimonadaceae bacterium]|jgi:uncharacterized protein (TIGR04255 family)|nr:TIGR04255 family protein [Candidatus Saccharimonadaceae bacterium]
MIRVSMPTPDASRAATVRRRSYAHPPVVERIVEVHVIPGPTSIRTAREALTARWSEFGIVEELPVGAVQFSWNIGDGTVQTTHEQGDARLRFWREDRQRLFQVSRELFVANDLSMEPGWPDLFPLFRRGYADFRTVLQPRSVVKAVLRYLNRIELPKATSADTVFTIFPTLPLERQRSGAAFQMVVDLGDVGSGPSLLNLVFAGSEAQPVYMLNLTVESGARPVEDPEALFQWANEAHGRMTELFESSITPKARELFAERS